MGGSLMQFNYEAEIAGVAVELSSLRTFDKANRSIVKPISSGSNHDNNPFDRDLTYCWDGS